MVNVAIGKKKREYLQFPKWDNETKKQLSKLMCFKTAPLLQKRCSEDIH